ncbi:hypothetical protein CC86DRAFT_382384 [Ophiobolus disseminans]|uniref:Uncharacterized protein n=1 Tax=Ophiobolus disseminans TaxID=1469910 RepID=A0A6A7A1A1_9PLEO|nr:hypothetical protein CC86DRAFT_382384 [Ophiobolus disseminans]
MLGNAILPMLLLRLTASASVAVVPKTSKTLPGTVGTASLSARASTCTYQGDPFVFETYTQPNLNGTPTQHEADESCLPFTNSATTPQSIVITFGVYCHLTTVSSALVTPDRLQSTTRCKIKWPIIFSAVVITAVA